MAILLQRLFPQVSFTVREITTPVILALNTEDTVFKTVGGVPIDNK